MFLVENTDYITTQKKELIMGKKDALKVSSIVLAAL